MVQAECRAPGMTEKKDNYIAFFLFFPLVRCFPHTPADAGHMTANAGDNIVFNCGVEFPGGHPVPYVVQWWKKVSFVTFMWESITVGGNFVKTNVYILINQDTVQNFNPL